MVFLRSGSPDTQGLSALSPGKEERGGERPCVSGEPDLRNTMGHPHTDEV